VFTRDDLVSDTCRRGLRPLTPPPNPLPASEEGEKDGHRGGKKGNSHKRG